MARSVRSSITVALVTLTVLAAHAVPASAQSRRRSEASDLDLELAGWPLIAVSGVMMALFGEALVQVASIDRDPDFLAYRVRVGAERPDATNVCDVARSTFGDAEAARARLLCDAGDDAESRGFAFLTAGLASFTLGLVLVIADLAIEPAREPDDVELSLAVGANRIALTGRF